MRQPTVWTEEGLEAFKKLQVSMGRYQLLSFLKTDMIDKESIVTLCTDASLHGMSGVLLQIIKGKEYVMGLVSKSSTQPNREGLPSNKNYMLQSSA